MEKKASTTYITFDEEIASAIVAANTPATATTVARLAELLRNLNDTEVIVLVETGSERACLGILRDGGYKNVVLLLQGTQRIASPRFHVTYETALLPGLGRFQVTRVRLAEKPKSGWLKSKQK